MNIGDREVILGAYQAARDSGKDLPPVIDHKTLKMLLQENGEAGPAFLNTPIEKRFIVERIGIGCPRFLELFKQYTHIYLSFFYNYHWDGCQYVVLADNPLTHFTLSAFEASKAKYSPLEIMDCIRDFPHTLSQFLQGMGKANIIGEYFLNCQQSRARIIRYLKAKELLEKREKTLQKKINQMSLITEQSYLEVETVRLKKQWPFARTWHDFKKDTIPSLSDYMVKNLFPSLNRKFKELYRVWYVTRYTTEGGNANYDLEVAYFLDSAVIQIAENKQQLVDAHDQSKKIASR